MLAGWAIGSTAPTLIRTALRFKETILFGLLFLISIKATISFASMPPEVRATVIQLNPVVVLSFAAVAVLLAIASLATGTILLVKYGLSEDR